MKYKVNLAPYSYVWYLWQENVFLFHFTACVNAALFVSDLTWPFLSESWLLKLLSGFSWLFSNQISFKSQWGHPSFNVCAAVKLFRTPFISKLQHFNSHFYYINYQGQVLSALVVLIVKWGNVICKLESENLFCVKSVMLNFYHCC